MSFLVDKEIHVIGIQRTGQHAVTSWLIGHFDSVLYKNCMSQLGQQKKIVGIEPPFWSFSANGEKRNLIHFETGNSALILGTEFTVFDVGLNPNIEKQKQQLCKKFSVDHFSKSQEYIIVIRNPYNQYSSVLNWGKNRLLSHPSSFSKMWVKVAKECLGHTNFFNEKTVLVYDNWFNDSKYRREIENKIGLKEDDSRLNVVMKIGYGRSWGSSFDGMKSKRKAQKMDVLNRWVNVKDDSRFVDLCNKKELVDLAEQYGWKCPIHRETKR